MSSGERAIVPIDPHPTFWQTVGRKLHEINPFKDSQEIDTELVKNTIWKLLSDIKEGGFCQKYQEEPRNRAYSVILKNGQNQYIVELSRHPSFYQTSGDEESVSFWVRDYEDEWEEAKPNRIVRHLSLTFGFDGKKTFFEPDFNRVSIFSMSKKFRGADLKFSLKERIGFANELLSAQIDPHATQVEFDQETKYYQEEDSDWIIFWVNPNQQEEICLNLQDLPEVEGTIL